MIPPTPFATHHDLSDLLQARESFLAGEPIEPGAVRPSVLESWVRSRAWGVDPRTLVPQRPDPERLRQARGANRHLMDTAVPFLEVMHDALAEEPHLIALSDADGLILCTRVGPGLPAAALKAGNLVAGASWRERDIGCNGIGTCLAAGEPVLLVGPEHFQQAYVGWTCIGVPIRDGTGEVVGAIDLSVPNEGAHAYSWGWLLSVAKGIEAALERPMAGGRAEAELEVEEMHAPLQSVRGVLEGLLTPVDFPASHARFLDEALSDLEDLDVGDMARENLLLRRDRELLERLIDEIPVMVVIYDPGIRQVRVNRHAERVLGWTNDDLRHRDIMELCYPDPAYREEVRRFMASLEVGWRDFEVATKRGTTVPVTWANIRLTDQRQVGIGVDVTERKEAEEQLRVALDGTRDALKERDNVLAVVSHDLRNPVSTLMMASSLLLEDISEEKKQTQLTVIRRAVKQMQRLIDDLLDASRVEGGGLQIVPEPCRCADLVQAAVQAQMPLAEAASRTLVAGDAPDLLVDADRGRIHQVFVNLISNAIEHTTEGGRIVVRAEAGPEGDVIFSVADDGHGIPEADLPRVFDRYWQARKSRRAGAGLGLAIARGIVQAHQGRIRVESEPGRGTTFRFSLPRSPER